jgi:hypothetical protein
MANPNPARITDASWWFMQQLLALEPGTQNGGIYANKAGYHNARSNLQASPQWSNDYSIRLPADRRGPADKAAGYDWTFPEAQRGDYRRIMLYGRRIAVAFAGRDPRLAGWREVLVQADPDANAEGYDFVTWTTRTPDSSHLWHMHLSELRQFTEDRANKEAMLSVLRGEEETMPITDEDAKKVARETWSYILGSSGPSAAVAQQDTYRWVKTMAGTWGAKLDAILAAALDDGDVTVQLTPEMVAALQELRDAMVTEAEVRDAVADGLEGGAAAVRADA